MESLLVAIAGGIVQGLITWGALRVELRWLRADVEGLKARATVNEQHCFVNHATGGSHG